MIATSIYRIQNSKSIMSTEIPELFDSATDSNGCSPLEQADDEVAYPKSHSEDHLHARQVRTVYLITYSQANENLVSSREEFAQCIVQSFVHISGKSDLIEHWVCSKEPHKKTSGFHYHMAIKLKHARRWLLVRKRLVDKHGINVNFSNVHANYYSAWLYVTKEDQAHVQSIGHPDLSNHKAAKQSKRKKSNKRNKKNSLSVFDVSQLVVKKGIKTRLELLAFASQQKKAGKDDLAQFIANRGPKVVAEALQVGWDMEEAEVKLERQRLTRLQVLEKSLEGQCADQCEGKWLTMAKSVLSNNGITHNSFASAVKDLLVKGRGKYRNVMVNGPANCGKTFLLNPLNTIYNTFTNPATSSFAWVGAETAEVLFLNDFRWSPQVLAWHDMLLLLEGQTVHLPAPKCHYAKDITFNSDTPIFCTGKQEIIFVRGGNVDERESEMMRCRWKVFRFNYQIPEDEQINVPACPRCFAQLILK